jgi:hypothetical protein
MDPQLRYRPTGATGHLLYIESVLRYNLASEITESAGMAVFSIVLVGVFVDVDYYTGVAGV